MYVALGFKIMTLTSIQHTGTQVFDSIFLWEEDHQPPNRPNNTPRNSCLLPPISTTPILETTPNPHSLNWSNKGPTLETSALRWQICIITSVNETKLSLLTEHLIHITQK